MNTVQWTKLCVAAATVLLYVTYIYICVCVCHVCVLDTHAVWHVIGGNCVLPAQ